MGLAYALVHLKFTIPLAIVLSALGRPFLTRIDATRIIFLIVVAVTATIPWDSYLIRTGVWTYPEDAVLGPTLFAIPIEELFFFVIQTYITALLYILCNKPVLLAQYLSTPNARPSWVNWGARAGQLFLAGLSVVGGFLVAQGGESTYLGLILAWACPFAFFTWCLAGSMILQKPWATTLIPVLCPTIFLWVVDEMSLRNGVWSIETGTKFGSSLFGSLDIEEAVFFLVTNMLIAFGIAAFDRGAAVCDLFPEKFPRPADSLPVGDLLRARFTRSSSLDMRRIEGLRDAVARLRKKSRSFYIASSVFPGRLRIDLTLLYSYCRLADDLVDDAPTVEEARVNIAKLRRYLDLKYDASQAEKLQAYMRESFPPSAQSALELLPSHILPSEPLYGLLDGFETDLEFKAPTSAGWPIKDEADLELYASRVAATIGELCLHLVFHHSQHATDRDALLEAAREMGVALQYVNIARDVSVDATMSRVYLPITWLKEEEGGPMTPEQVVAQPHGDAIARLRTKLLDRAFARYAEFRPPMRLLPPEGRGPMTVAVESYMEIGRVLAEGGLRVEGKATVPRSRRLGVVWKTLTRER